MNDENLSPERELVRDLIAVVTVFSARLHGLRSYRKVLKEAALQKRLAWKTSIPKGCLPTTA
jgi:putative resolvase